MVDQTRNLEQIKLPKGYSRVPTDYTGQLYLESQMRDLSEQIQGLRVANVPQGWILAPVEPTAEMLQRAYEAQGEATIPSLLMAYRAMFNIDPQAVRCASTAVADGKWYWVRYEGLGKTYEAPALFRENAKAFYSVEFSGIPAHQVEVLGEYPPAQPKSLPAGWTVVAVPEITPADEPDWDECIAQAEEATGIKVERHTMSIVIREVRRWLASRHAATQDFQSIESIQYWINAYSSPESGPHFQGHGLVVKMLKEYAILRASLATQPESAHSQQEQQWAPFCESRIAKDEVQQDHNMDCAHSCWVPVTQELLNHQDPWLFGPMWIATKGGEVIQGHYDWRQGRNPDRFITDNGDEWAFDFAYVMPIVRPTPPITMAEIATAQGNS